MVTAQTQTCIRELPSKRAFKTVSKPQRRIEPGFVLYNLVLLHEACIIISWSLCGNEDHGRNDHDYDEVVFRVCLPSSFSLVGTGAVDTGFAGMSERWALGQTISM